MQDHPAILIVDDDDLLCDMLEEVLSDAGYHVVTARSAGAAFEILATHAVAVVLTGLNLGGRESGFAILESLSAHEPPPAAVLMTAFVSHEVAQQARDLGAHETLRKPFRNRDVIRVVEAARRHHRGLPAAR